MTFPEGFLWGGALAANQCDCLLYTSYMNSIVAANIKRLREERKLSMEELAKFSGVSKSMIAQIERGAGNPTLSTLWKISNGLKVPFDSLTVRPKTQHEMVKISEIQPLFENEGCLLYTSRCV